MLLCNMYFSKQKNYIYIVLCLLFMSRFPHVMSVHVEDLSKQNFSRQKNRCSFCTKERPANTGTPLTLVFCFLFMLCFPHVLCQHVEDLSWKFFSEPQKRKRWRERLLMQALLWPLFSVCPTNWRLQSGEEKTTCCIFPNKRFRLFILFLTYSWERLQILPSQNVCCLSIFFAPICNVSNHVVLKTWHEYFLE